MDTVEIMSDKVKRNMGIISFLPLAAHVAWLIQFIYLHIVYPDIRTSAILSDNYGSTLVLFSLCFALTAAVLVYFVIHLARTKMLNAGSKLSWIVFMTFGAPVAFPVFWYSEIRNEPEELPVHANIA